MSPRKSILLILIGSVLAAGLLTIILRLASHVPAIFAFVLFSVPSMLIFYSGIKGLKRGVIIFNAKGRVSVYERRDNPAGFWFYFSLYILLSFTTLAAAIYLLLTLPMTK
jgi:hypothetical protein